MTTSPAAGASTRPLTPEEDSTLRALWAAWDADDFVTAERFVDLRFEKTYDVYRVHQRAGSVVLKKSSEDERVVYRKYLAGALPVPACLAEFRADQDVWLLLEDVGGHDLQVCTANDADVAGRALATLSASQWQETPDPMAWGEEAHVGLRRQGFWPVMWHGVDDDVLRAWKKSFLRLLGAPRGLVQGDCLSMNVLRTDDGVRVIDWTHGGIGHYCRDVGRFLAYAGEGTSYDMSAEAQERFVAAYFEMLTRSVTTSLTRDQFLQDLLMQKFLEWVPLCADDLIGQGLGTHLPADWAAGEDPSTTVDLARRVLAGESWQPVVASVT